MSEKPKNEDFNVWVCKIVVPAGSKFPPGFDSPPRMAATGAIQQAGIEVLCCMSGWGGEELTQGELDSMPRPENKSEIYYAGTLDIDESKKH